jgi:hypothetical protein
MKRSEETYRDKSMHCQATPRQTTRNTRAQQQKNGIMQPGSKQQLGKHTSA